MLGILVKQFLDLPAQLAPEPCDHLRLSLLDQGLVHQLVPRIPCDVATDKLAVHAHRLSGYMELPCLQTCKLAEALGIKVRASTGLVLDKTAAEHVVRIYRRSLLVKARETQRTAQLQVEVLALVQFPVAASAALLVGHRNL